jgi:hypothetical protein
MSRLYSTLFGFHCFVAALVTFSSVMTLAGVASGPRPRGGELVASVLLPTFLVASAYGAWALQAQQRPVAATALLGGIWGLAAVGLLVVLSQARWN